SGRLGSKEMGVCPRRYILAGRTAVICGESERTTGGPYMKKLLIAASAFALLTGYGAASAADLQRPLVKAPIAPPVQLWTGFYVGANVGYSFGRSDTDTSLTNSVTGAVLAAGSNNFDMNGVIGGGQVGYNFQLSNWLLGVEADIQGSAQKGSSSFLCAVGVCTPPIVGAAVVPGAAVAASFNQSLDWFGTVRGRAGVLVTPNWLLYGTGGLAYGDVTTSRAIATVTPVPVAAAFSNSATQVGWTAGAGIEGRIFGNWTAKL